MEEFINIISITASQLFQLLGVIFFFGFVLKWLGEQSLAHYTYGSKLFNFMSLIGTPVHEFGHFIMCKIFRYHVDEVVWYQKPNSNGTLGYVNFSYNPGSVYQRIGKFFVGVGPLFSGPLAIFLLLYVLLPDAYDAISVQIGTISTHWSFETFEQILQLSWTFLVALFNVDHALSWQFYVFLVLACSIAVHIRLSKPDLESATSGIIAITVLLLLLNVISEFLHLSLSDHVVTYVAHFNAFYISIMIVITVIALLFFMTSVIWGAVKNRTS